MYAAESIGLKPKGTALRVMVLLTCVLSIVGSASIVLSYACFKNSRSKTRQILVHLSIVNLGAGLSDLLGGAIYFGQSYEDAVLTNSSSKATVCRILASASLYCAFSSILWSATLSAHLYFVLTSSVDVSRHLRFSYVFDYGFPVLFVIWLLSTQRLGYNNHLANCNIIYEDVTTKRRDIVAAVFGNDLPTYTAAIVISALSVSIRAQITEIRNEMSSQSRQYTDATRSSILQKVDTKFAVFPAAFIALRIWRSLQIAVLIYNPNRHSVPDWIKYALALLSDVGDTGQGITNALLFVLLSRKVRRNFVDRLCSWIRRTRSFKEPVGLFGRSGVLIQNMDSVPDVRVKD